MSKYLISFPAEAMASLSAEDLQRASDESRAVVREAKEAGVWVFGGGLDTSVEPVRVDETGGSTPGTYPQTGELDGGVTIIEAPSREAALEWAAKIAAACRCAQEVRRFHDDPES